MKEKSAKPRPSDTAPPEMTHRARKILHAVVSEYLLSGDAVGSRTVTRRHGIDLSPATVRNVMADLEDMGLLAQPHTSAGRVPTRSGLRFFIDALLKVRSLSPKEKDLIRAQFPAQAQEVDSVMQRASRVLSEITHHAGIVLAPNPSQQKLQHLEFVPLTGGRYLCILVTSDGHIENKLIETEARVDSERLERIHNYLAELLGGHSLAEVRAKVLAELGEEKNQYDELVASALALSKAALDRPERPAEVVVSGKANLLAAGKAADEVELARMRDLLHTLEEKETLVRLLDRTLESDGIHVVLGAETAVEALGDSSVVAASYGPEDHPLGAIAVIGPTRMNYGKVMSVVDFTADLISEIVQAKSAAGR
jgi:heat-inducible transcriptional repressor